MNIQRFLAGAAAVAAVATPGAAAAAAEPAAHGTQTLDCDGLGTVTILLPPDVAGDNWSAAQVEGDGHLIPVSFSYTVLDTTLGQVLDRDVVSRGPAHHQQATISCSSTQTATLADLLPTPPGVELPVAAQPTDQVDLVFTATAVAKGSR